MTDPDRRGPLRLTLTEARGLWASNGRPVTVHRVDLLEDTEGLPLAVGPGEVLATGDLTWPPSLLGWALADLAGTDQLTRAAPDRPLPRPARRPPRLQEDPRMTSNLTAAYAAADLPVPAALLAAVQRQALVEDRIRAAQTGVEDLIASTDLAALTPDEVDQLIDRLVLADVTAERAPRTFHRLRQGAARLVTTAVQACADELTATVDVAFREAVAALTADAHVMTDADVQTAEDAALTSSEDARRAWAAQSAHRARLGLLCQARGALDDAGVRADLVGQPLDVRRGTDYLTAWTGRPQDQSAVLRAVDEYRWTDAVALGGVLGVPTPAQQEAVAAALVEQWDAYQQARRSGPDPKVNQSLVDSIEAAGRRIAASA